MTISTARRWSDAELLALPKDGYDREIIDGEMVMSPAGAEHGAIIMAIAGPLHMYVTKKNLGQVLDGQTGCRMATGDVLSPDVSFVAQPRWEAHRKSRDIFVSGGPDLVVKVLSPDDSSRIIKKKINLYFTNGTRLAWIVHPRKRCVTVYHAPTSADILAFNDTLDGEHVVPGFTLKINGIFRD